MAKRIESFDVWIETGNTVYQGVPYDVVSRWTLEGRLGQQDRLREAGTKDWKIVAEWEEFQNQVQLKTHSATISSNLDNDEEEFELDDEPALVLEPIEAPFPNVKAFDDEDDDVDMIPLIDISMVLLVFFIMTATVAAVSKITVPEVKNASKIEGDPQTMSVYLDRLDSGVIDYGIGQGTTAPGAENNQLSEADFYVKLDQAIDQQTNPPRIRIAGHKEIGFEVIERLLKQLESRKLAGRIISYSVEVGEKR
jgi:biopolymer transport protein ExbD